MAVTGTPGTGKTTATERLDSDLEVVHLNDIIRREEELVAGQDPDLDTVIADLDRVERRLEGLDDVVIESHLAHRFPADRVIVLRCRPDRLADRLRERGEPPITVEENAESEALDIILAEAVDRHGEAAVYEIDTTDMDPEAVAAEIDAVIDDEREPRVGIVSFVEYL